MLEQLSDQAVIERRITAVQGLRQVVHAIGALARAQLPLAESATGQAMLYLDAVDSILHRLVGAPESAEGDHQLFVVVGPERGFCGALAQRIVEQVPPVGALGIVGRRLGEAAKLDPAIEPRVRFELGGAVTHEDAEGVAVAIAEAVLGLGHNGQVDVLYPSSGRSDLHRSMLLPKSQQLAQRSLPETYSPLDTVVRAAIAEAMTGRLALAAAEALRSEISARVVAAEQMTRACDDKLEGLRQDWRVARQEQITSELMEIVAGTRTG